MLIRRQIQFCQFKRVFRLAALLDQASESAEKHIQFRVNLLSINKAHQNIVRDEQPQKINCRTGSTRSRRSLAHHYEQSVPAAGRTDGCQAET